MPNVAKVVLGEAMIPTGRDSLLGYYDRGGRAELIEAAAQVPNQPPPAVLSGVVYDSLDSRGLAGAVVRVAGAEDSAVTDGAGAFRFRVREEGARLVTIRHPRLGLVADRSVQEVSLRLGEETPIMAAVPAMETFAKVFCGAEARDALKADLVGLAYETTGAPAEDLTVEVRWISQVGRSSVRSESVSTRSAARGVYSLCGIPASRALTVQLRRGKTVLLDEHTTLETPGPHWLDLRPSTP